MAQTALCFPVFSSFGEALSAFIPPREKRITCDERSGSANDEDDDGR
jgi:hypothetical protein